IRGRCWKLLLEVHHVSAQEYVSLVKRGKPEEYGKIRNDTFRTLATDQKYLDAVKEDSLIRVLCAFAWSNQATRPQDSEVFTYVQGMNVLAAPILYTMSEMEAFYAYSNLIKYCCPLYVQPTLQGVHCGIKLLERCLDKIDPELYKYLKSKSMSAELYALPPILTICACTPPLSQVMQLWDFLLAWGIHLNILCIIAQLYLIRGELMAHASPMKLLRILPDLDADKIIRETMRMVKLLPDDLYDLLVRHPYDPTVAEQIDW
ncbi:MAG: rab-GTPase-TBC domain-containing protein, partial [Benniella sp.]